MDDELTQEEILSILNFLEEQEKELKEKQQKLKC